MKEGRVERERGPSQGRGFIEREGRGSGGGVVRERKENDTHHGSVNPVMSPIGPSSSSSSAVTTSSSSMPSHRTHSNDEHSMGQGQGQGRGEGRG